MKKSAQLGASLAAVLLLAALAPLGCTSTVSKRVSDEGVPEEVVFPEYRDRLLAKWAITPNLEDLAKIRPGMNKRDLYNILSAPHFKEVFLAREWDYIFKFPQGAGQPDVVCQYKIVFDKDRIARNFYWKPESCRSFVEQAR